MGQSGKATAPLIGGLVAAAWLSGFGPAAAFPLAAGLPHAEPQPTLLVPARHHHHHHHHWRYRYSRSGQYDPSEVQPPGPGSEVPSPSTSVSTAPGVAATSLHRGKRRFCWRRSKAVDPVG
jgi:hypothetical protein